jgi:K+-sensing histidine kinase KdpD
MQRFLEGSLRYGVAVLAVGVALAVKLLLDPLTVQDTLLLLVCGAIISALYGGLGPGLLATVVSALITGFFFLYPKGAFSRFRLEMIDVAAFALDGVPAIVLTSSPRSARNGADKSALDALRFFARARSASC